MQTVRATACSGRRNCQRIKRSESLQNVHESQATQRSQATHDSFSRSFPRPESSFLSLVSKARAVSFDSLAIAANAGSGAKHAAQLRGTAPRLRILGAVFEALQPLLEDR